MVTTEKHTVSGDQLLGKVKELIREGNVRNVRLIHDDKTLLDIPLTVGVPVAAAAILVSPASAARSPREITAVASACPPIAPPRSLTKWGN